MANSEPDDESPIEIAISPFNSRAIQVDRSAMALAAAARASIQARVWLAAERPRSLPRVQDIILSQMKRPSLAAAAVYRVERGKKQSDTGAWVTNYAEGASIKLANSLRIAMGNMGTEDAVIADDPEYRTIAVVAIDYETNSSETRQIVIKKTVERKAYGGRPPEREIVGSRKNSHGETVYLCRATESEIQEMGNAAAARARRNAILALVPADLVEDAIRNAKDVMLSDAASQRAASIAKHKAAFAKLGATQAQLAEYLGRSIDESTADDLAGLTMLATAIRDGHTTWRAAVAASREANTDEHAPVQSTEVPR